MTESTKIDYVSIVQDLRDEADLCRNETATDIADLLDDAASCIVAMKSQFVALRADLTGAQSVNAKLRAGVDQLRVSAINADWHTFDQVCKEMKEEAMTTPTPKDNPPFDPPVFCSGIERDCKHGQLARSCNICELERDLAAAKDTISKYHERIISQHAQIDDLKWSLWKIEGKHKAAMLEVITKLAAAQEEIAAWKYRAQVYCDEGNGQRERAQAAEARAEENARDAGRYRHLRDTYPDYRGLVAVVDLSTDASAWLSHEYLDRAVDAAMQSAAIAEGKK